MELAQNITVIPAKRIIGTQKHETKVQKTRVAAYCRVSTDYEEQESSYDSQVTHYTEYINSNPEWVLARIYADDVSGTNTKKRVEFKQMIEDCKAGLIDMILVKSISRFARNTVDCLKYTRELKALNIAIYFEKENINTLDAKGEVLITIMAALAQQESESIAANVRLGLQFRNQQGKVQVNTNWFLGYTKDEEGRLIIEPEQAKVVKRIYAEYLDGKSFLQIKRGLEADGILNGAGHKKWYESNIKQILTNEKYIGDALLQKTYTVNTLEKKRVRNDGIAPKYYVEGCHEAIIDKDVFLRVQAEMTRRANIVRDGKKRIYSSKYALSSMVFCGHCGDIYRRVSFVSRGNRYIVWKCVSRVLKGKSGIDCSGRPIKEQDLHDAIVTAVNDAWYDREDVLAELQENIKSVLEEDLENRIKEIDSEIRQKQTELLSAGKNQEKIDKISDEILSLREKRQGTMIDAANRRDMKNRIEDLATFLNEQVAEVTEYSDLLVRRLIEKVTIYDYKVVVEFKSGLEIEVDV